MAYINKVVITEEAEFDYEEILGLPMPKADIKEACENYIESRYDGGRTLWGYYYKWKYDGGRRCAYNHTGGDGGTGKPNDEYEH